jgi:hypothetical protein
MGETDTAPPIFEPGVDVKAAGVLLAVPALICNGLLKYIDKYLVHVKGFYGTQSLLLIFAFMALLRIKNLEQVRYWDPGELGRIVGLDRIPEIKTLRKKTELIATHGNPAAWSKALATDWIGENTDEVGAFYVDGHVRVYHGKQTKLPKRYISRQRLCLRGITDYWVNDAVGLPFFRVSKALNTGLLHALQEDIVPQLLEATEPQESRRTPRFEMIFDREGYSPKTMKQLWETHRISCTTYNKYAKEDWPESEFVEKEIVHPNGETSSIFIAERGRYFKDIKFQMREIRKLSESGHQTSILTTNPTTHMTQTAPRMFARWSQENFFKYMLDHYGIDRLVDYQMEAIDDTSRVVNPQYRALSSQIRSMAQKLSRKKAEYGDIHLVEDIDKAHVNAYLQKKAALKARIDEMTQTIEDLKAKRKETDTHITFDKLPENEQFKNLKKGTKQFVDIIKMIAYRAETAMALLVRPELSKKDEARAIVRQILRADADLEPDLKNGTLTVSLHNLTTPRGNQYAQYLCYQLNEMEVIFPGTEFRLVYKLVAI